MKKAFIVLSLFFLSCFGGEEPILVTVPGTEREFDIGESDPIGLDTFKDMSEEVGGVDIVEVPTSGGTPNYFEAAGLKEWVKQALYQNPLNRELFDLDAVKAFNVTKYKQEKSPYVSVEKDIYDLFPRGMVHNRAQELLDEGLFYSNPPSGQMRPNYSLAKEIFEKVAGQKDNLWVKSHAENFLAMMYLGGRIGMVDGAPNYKRAQHYLERLAEQDGNLYAKGNAENLLAKMYLNGNIGIVNGVPNYAKAQQYLERAASYNLDPNFYSPLKAEIESILAKMYLSGHAGVVDGVPNYEKAQQYLERVAEQNSNLHVKGNAEVLLGLMYQNGDIGMVDGVPNYEKAQHYFDRAVAHGVNLHAKL